MPDSTEILFWGAVLRVGQALIEGSPTIVIGLVIAAVFQRLLGRQGTFRFFGGNTWKGIFIAWLMGMLLPVCSLGVFPILREMRKAGLSAGTILAFGLAGPLFNPLSILYGLTLSEPLTIFCFLLASLVVVTVAGLVWDRLFPETAQPIEELPPVQPGLRRMTAVLLSAAQASTGKPMLYILAALFGVAGLSVVLPHGILQSTMAHDDPLSPLLMSAVAIPVYDSPIRVMMQLGLMFDHGNSVGAALTLLILGAGMNIGTLVWAGANYGFKRGVAWLVMIVGVTLAIAYAVERPLFDEGVTIDGHTHVFDEFTAPTLSGSSDMAARSVRQQLDDEFDPWELASLLGICGLVLLGAVARAFESRLFITAWLERASQQRTGPQPFWNRPLSGTFLTGVALVGLIVLSVVGCYIYYPSPDEAFDMIRPVRVNALIAIKNGHADHAKREIRIWDDLIRKTQVGLYLRYGRVNADVDKKGEELREHLEVAYDAFLDGTWTPALGERSFNEISAAHRRFHSAVERQVHGVGLN
jgi:hypothetical protein